MFSSIQSIPGLIFARSNVKAKIRPGVEARPGIEIFSFKLAWIPGSSYTHVSVF